MRTRQSHSVGKSNVVVSHLFISAFLRCSMFERELDARVLFGASASSSDDAADVCV